MRHDVVNVTIYRKGKEGAVSSYLTERMVVRKLKQHPFYQELGNDRHELLESTVLNMSHKNLSEVIGLINEKGIDEAVRYIKEKRLSEFEDLPKIKRLKD